MKSAIRNPKKPQMLRFRNNRLIVVVAIILVFALYFVFVTFSDKAPVVSQMELPVRNEVVPQLPMIAVFKNKIVYTTQIASPKTDYIDDCRVRGGTFNSCDTGCDVGVTKCAITCAYTCTTPTK